MILPPFMLFFFAPTLWIVSALGNFIIDSIVLLIISIFIYKKFTWQLYKKSIIPVFLYGFLSDFLGVLYLMAISIGSGAEYYEGNDIGKQILSGIYLATNHSCYDSVYGVCHLTVYRSPPPAPSHPARPAGNGGAWPSARRHILPPRAIRLFCRTGTR